MINKQAENWQTDRQFDYLMNSKSRAYLYVIFKLHFSREASIGMPNIISCYAYKQYRWSLGRGLGVGLKAAPATTNVKKKKKEEEEEERKKERKKKSR